MTALAARGFGAKWYHFCLAETSQHLSRPVDNPNEQTLKRDQDTLGALLLNFLELLVNNFASQTYNFSVAKQLQVHCRFDKS